MNNPYFQTRHYEEENEGRQIEKSIENKISAIIKKIRRKKNV